jgi:hypothetical protein
MTQKEMPETHEDMKMSLQKASGNEAASGVVLLSQLSVSEWYSSGHTRVALCEPSDRNLLHK